MKKRYILGYLVIQSLIMSDVAYATSIINQDMNLITKYNIENTFN